MCMTKKGVTAFLFYFFFLVAFLFFSFYQRSAAVPYCMIKETLDLLQRPSGDAVREILVQAHT